MALLHILSIKNPSHKNRDSVGIEISTTYPIIKISKNSMYTLLYYASTLLFITSYIYSSNLQRIGEFTLIEKDGQTITNNTLKGKICVFSFIFTRCATQCPMMSQNFAVMQNIIEKYKDVYLISITGDPEFDNTKILQEYAQNYGARNRWLFLTGDKETIYDLSINKFQLGLKKATTEEIKQGSDIIMHSTRFILVDENGIIKGNYDSREEKSIKKLHQDLDRLVKNRDVFSKLPTLNAILNSISATLLILGFIFIKRKNTKAHKIYMISAFCTSTLFLISYLIYHYRVGSVKFQGTGFIRQIYFFILLTHTILAIAIVPLAIRTVYLALKSSFDRHKKIAYITLPIWVYVSISGVVIYLLLYQFF